MLLPFDLKFFKWLYTIFLLSAVLMSGGCHNSTLIPPFLSKNTDPNPQKNNVEITQFSKERELQQLFEQEYIDPLSRYIEQYKGDASMASYVQTAEIERERRCTEVERAFEREPKDSRTFSKLEKGYGYSCPHVVADFARKITQPETLTETPQQPKHPKKVQNKKKQAKTSCGSGKRNCNQMVSCEEAYFYLNQCGIKKLDRDKNGVPCESICGK